MLETYSLEMYFSYICLCLLFKNYCIYLFCIMYVCICVGASMSPCAGRNRRTTFFGLLFPFSTVWFPGIKFRSWDWAARAFAHWAILSAVLIPVLHANLLSKLTELNLHPHRFFSTWLNMGILAWVSLQHAGFVVFILTFYQWKLQPQISVLASSTIRIQIQATLY